MKTTKMTKKHTIPKTEINFVNWIKFANVCIIFETTNLCYLFLIISSVKKSESNLKSRFILFMRHFKHDEPVREILITWRWN